MPEEAGTPAEPAAMWEGSMVYVSLERNDQMRNISRLSVTVVAVALGFLSTLPPVQSANQPAGDGWVSLFNGKNLDGWVRRGGKAEYRAENNEIIGKTVPNTSNTFLCTTKDYSDF